MDSNFQDRVSGWMIDCFGEEIARDKTERADRFVEEALELAQSIGWTKDRAHALVEYVFSRPVGETGQEVGGVMVTLAALCNVVEPDRISIFMEATRELERITKPEMVEKIRAEQASKPTGSALPAAVGFAFAAPKGDAQSLSPNLWEKYMGAIAYAVDFSGGADSKGHDRDIVELGARRAIDFLRMTDNEVRS